MSSSDDSNGEEPSDNESDEEVLESDSTDYRVEEESSSAVLENPETFAEGDWILIRYETAPKGKLHQSFYIGKITAVVDNPHSYNVTCLRKIARKLENLPERFYEPTPEDEDCITVDMIVKRLKPPMKVGTERRYFWQFCEDFSGKNINVQ